jgi:hypothetical protein
MPMREGLKKKEQGIEPCSKNCVDPTIPQSFDLILADGMTLLVRVRAPPETWTIRLKPFGSACAQTTRPVLLFCHHFQQRMFKLRAVFVMIANSPGPSHSACGKLSLW